MATAPEMVAQETDTEELEDELTSALEATQETDETGEKQEDETSESTEEGEGEKEAEDIRGCHEDQGARGRERGA